MTTRLYPCAHCKEPSSGAIALQVHLCNSRVNVLTGAHYFCCLACREAWYDVPTSDDVVHVLRGEDASGNLHAAHGPLDVLVIHHDGDAGAVVEVTPPRAPGASILAGSPHELYVMESPDHLNQWWRGEAIVAPVPFPEEPDPQ